MSFENFIITGVQRTGSSSLAERINSHPEIACGWEWTEHVAFRQKMAMLEDTLGGEFSALDSRSREHIQSQVDKDSRWLGFRRLFGASNKWLIQPRWSAKLAADRFQTHLKWFRAHPEVHLIHIVRDNHMEWLKSKFVAKEAGAYVGKQYPSDLKVTIPVKNAIRRVQSKIWIDTELSKLDSSNPYLQIKYENLAIAPQAEAERIASFLKLDPEKLRSEQELEIKRQSKGEAADYIANYDQLYKAVSTRFG